MKGNEGIVLLLTGKISYHSFIDRLAFLIIYDSRNKVVIISQSTTL